MTDWLMVSRNPLLPKDDIRCWRFKRERERSFFFSNFSCSATPRIQQGRTAHIPFGSLSVSSAFQSWACIRFFSHVRGHLTMGKRQESSKVRPRSGLLGFRRRGNKKVLSLFRTESPSLCFAFECTIGISSYSSCSAVSCQSYLEHQ